MHYSIIVAGDNYEDQLAPFQENNMEDCPKEYLEYYVDGEYYESEEDAIKELGEEKAKGGGYWAVKSTDSIKLINTTLEQITALEQKE